MHEVRIEEQDEARRSKIPSAKSNLAFSGSNADPNQFTGAKREKLEKSHNRPIATRYYRSRLDELSLDEMEALMIDNLKYLGVLSADENLHGKRTGTSTSRINSHEEQREMILQCNDLLCSLCLSCFDSSAAFQRHFDLHCSRNFVKQTNKRSRHTSLDSCGGGLGGTSEAGVFRFEKIVAKHHYKQIRALRESILDFKKRNK